MYRALAKMYSFGPDEVANMTPEQQDMYLDDSGESDTITFPNAAAARRYSELIGAR